jgi:hypothetical protein
LAAADLWITDVPATIAMMQTAFGLKPDGELLHFEDYGLSWQYAKVDAGPVTEFATKVEILAPLQGATPNRARSDYPYMVEWGESQRGGPAPYHATVVKTLQIDALVERLRDMNAIFRLDLPVGRFRRPRLFVGMDASGVYHAEYDGGLRLEFWEPYVEEREARRAFAESGQHAPAAPRIEARQFTVPDIQRATESLSRFIAWTPEREWTHEGAHCAAFGFADAHSARLELIEDRTIDPAALNYAAIGAAMRFADPDLAARERAIKAAGLPCTRMVANDGSGRDALRVDLGAAGQGIFDFVPPSV